MCQITAKDLILDVDSASGMSVRELCELCSLIQSIQPLRILELGTKHGRTTINMAKFSPAKAKIFSVDIKILPKEAISRFPEYSKITFFEGDTLTFDFKSEGLWDFNFILIDANHLEKYVINDTLRAFSLIRRGGTVVWHDYNKDKKSNNLQVTKALTRLNITPNVIFGTSLALLKIL